MNIWNLAKKYKIGIIIFVLAVGVRLALFVVNFNNAGSFTATIAGYDGYYEISQNLILGNGFSNSEGPEYPPHPLRPPVWIFLMALIAWVFGSYVPVFIFELIIGSLIPVLGMYLAKRVVSLRLATCVGVFLALEPTAVLHSILTVSETCFTFLFLIFCVLLFKYFDKQSIRLAVWSGLFLALAILIKPTIQFLPILIPIIFYFIFKKTISRGHIAHLACFLAVCVLTIFPWAYRNYREFGAWGISSQAAFNLYTVLVPTVLAIDNRTNFMTERLKIKFPDNMTDADINTGNSDYFTSQALPVLLRHKTALLKSMGFSAMAFFTHDGMLTVLEDAGVIVPNFLDKPAPVLLFSDPLGLLRQIVKYSTTPGVIILISRLFFIIFSILFFVGSWLYFKREKVSPHALFAILIVAYFVLVTMVNGFGMNARFRMPVNGFIATFAFYGFFVLWRFFSEKFSRLAAGNEPNLPRQD